MPKLKGEEPIPLVELIDVFTLDEHGWLHCNTCPFSTKQESNAHFHATVKHLIIFKPVQIVVKPRGVLQEEIAVIVPAMPEGA